MKGLEARENSTSAEATVRVMCSVERKELMVIHLSQIT